MDFLNPNYAPEEQKNLFEKWLLLNIQKAKISNILSFILSDTEHIRNCYESTAFIRSEEYQNALMLCIFALETNQRSYLAKVDSSLYRTENKTERKCHRRSNSQPLVSMPRKSILSQSHMKKYSRFHSSDDNNKIINIKAVKKCKSLPNLIHESSHNRPRSKTVVTYRHIQKKVSFKSEAEEAVPYFDYRSTMVTDTKSNVPIHVVNVEDIKIYTDVRYSASSSSTTPTKKTSLFNLFEVPLTADKIHSPEQHSLSSTSPSEYFLTESVVAGEKLRTKSAFLRPDLDVRKRKSSRQNLAHFIHTIHSTRPKVELERENAHFHLSEAIIAACTQIKWNKTFDEKYKIPRDCRIKQSIHHTVASRSQPPPKIRTKFTIGSVEDDTSSSLSSDEIEKHKSDSDDVNVPQMEWNTQMDINSPESIAISLMSKFRNQKLPSASNLLWMVSESQAPQTLLPIPDSFPINPDENLNFNAIRGHQFWAPPRQQIIFTVHPPPDRKRQMLSQCNRCAGCGMKVSAAYVHKFRYCDYTSKFFCTACHKLQVSTIPARVLESWDFKLNPVSNFAYKWLDQIWQLPLFHVSDLNPKLYSRVKPLSAAREARLQLKYVIDFINQCRFAEKEKDLIKKIPQHWIEDVDIWSMLDFINVKNGIFTTKISEIIKSCEEHIVKNFCEVRKYFNGFYKFEKMVFKFYF